MRVLIAPKNDAASKSLDCLKSWSKAGLLSTFCWWEADSGDGSGVKRIERGIETEMPLADALVGRADDVQLVGFCPMASVEPVRGDFASAVQRKIDEALLVLPYTDDLDAGCTMVFVPGKIGLEVPADLFNQEWDANVYVAPEDRDDPRGVNALAAGEDRLPAHSAHAIATIAGMWRSSDQGDKRVLVELNERNRPGPSTLVQVVRCFTRGVDVGYLADHVAETVFMPDGEWPNPDRPSFTRVDNPSEIVNGAASNFMEQHGQVLGLSPFEPYTVPGGRKYGLLEALRIVLRYFVNRLINKPGELVEKGKARLGNLAADLIERVDGGATGVRVLRPGEAAGEGGPKVELEDGLEVLVPNTDGPVQKTWMDLRGLALCLVDGRSLPDGIDSKFLERGDRRAIVTDPALIAPDPESGYNVITGERTRTICDPLALDPDFQKKEGPEQDSCPEPEPADELEKGEDGEEASVDPLLAERAEGSNDANTNSEAEFDDPENSDNAESASSQGQIVTESIEAQGGEVQVLPDKATSSLLWVIGKSLAGNMKKADAEFSELKNRIKALESKPVSEEAEEEEGKTASKVSTAKSRIARLAKLFGVTFGITVALCAAAFFLLPLVGAVVALVIVPLIWIYVAAREARSFLIRERRENQLEVQAQVDLVNMKLLAALREGDVLRLERRYVEYLDWAEIVGWYVHHPWIGQPLSQVSMDASVPQTLRPLAFQMAVGESDRVSLSRLGKETRNSVFDPGWLNDLYSTNQNDVVNEAVDPGLEGDIPDPAADTSEDPESLRREFLRAVRRGDYRQAIGHPMMNELLARLDNLHIDKAAKRIISAEDADSEPLPVSAAWFSAPTNLEGLIRRLSPSVARVRVKTTAGSGATGTGVLLPGEELMATALHVVDDAEEIMVVTANGDEFSATVKSVSAEDDLAVIRLDRKSELIGVSLGEGSSIDQGTPVVTLGFQGGMDGEPSFSWGLITATSRRVSFDGVGEGVPVIEANYQSAGGLSGGPVFNLEGEVVGIHSGSSQKRDYAAGLDHLSHAVPVERLIELISGGSDPGATLTWGASPASAAALNPAARAEFTGTMPSEYFDALLHSPDGQVFLPDHWVWVDSGKRENRVDVSVSSPSLEDTDSGTIKKYGGGNEFLRPLRLMVHRVDLTEPVALQEIAGGSATEG